MTLNFLWILLSFFPLFSLSISATLTYTAPLNTTYIGVASSTNVNFETNGINPGTPMMICLYHNDSISMNTTQINCTSSELTFCNSNTPFLIPSGMNGSDGFYFEITPVPDSVSYPFNKLVFDSPLFTIDGGKMPYIYIFFFLNVENNNSNKKK